MFSPVTLTWIAAPSVSASERKKCGTSSVGKPADLLAAELAFEHGVRAAGKVDRDLRLRFVHRQQEAVARDAGLVAQRLAQRLAERERAVLDGVVLVDVQVALAGELQREAAVLRDLLEHVIEEADAGRHLNGVRGIEVDGYLDLRFLRPALVTRAARRELAHDGRPGLLRRAIAADAAVRGCRGCARTPGPCRDRRSSRSRRGRCLVSRHVILDELRAGLAARAAVRLEVRADEHGVELDTLRAEGLEHEVVRARRSAACGKLVGAEPVLIRDHHEPVAAALQLRERREDAGHEAHFLEAVDLLVCGLLDQRAVAIDEQDWASARSSQRSEQPVVLLGRADADAQRARQPDLRAHVADEQVRGRARCERDLRIARTRRARSSNRSATRA